MRALALVLALALAAPVAAAAAPRTSLADVEDEVMCVTCGVPLNVSEAPAADRQRAFIRTRVARGDTKEEVLDALVAEYGERVLATPGTGGVDLSAWLVPGLLVLAGLGAVGLFLLRRRPATGPDVAPTPPELDPADARRLDAELARFER